MDIVERLRMTPSEIGTMTQAIEHMREAADEIVRLREEVAEWKQAANAEASERRKSHDEIERLREYERLVKFIASDYIELSHEKAQWQRDDWYRRCRAIQQKGTER